MSEKKEFVLVLGDKPRIIDWPCTIMVPVSGGQHEEQHLIARFEVIDQREIDALLAEASAADIETSVGIVSDKDGASKKRAEPGTPLLRRVVKGFIGLKEQDGGPAIPDEVAIPKMLPVPFVIDGLTRGYFEMLGRRLRKN